MKFFILQGMDVSWCGRRDLNPGSQAWKACVLNQLDDDRHSDTVVLETQKAIAALSADTSKTVLNALGEMIV
jgi:hypothetical protein